MKSEIILSWNVDANDLKNSIPKQQYSQIVVAMLAQQAKKTREGLGDMLSSDSDSDDDLPLSYRRAQLVPVVPDAD